MKLILYHSEDIEPKMFEILKDCGLFESEIDSDTELCFSDGGYTQYWNFSNPHLIAGTGNVWVPLRIVHFYPGVGTWTYFVHETSRLEEIEDSSVYRKISSRYPKQWSIPWIY